jgi:hypothetical protein
LVKALGGRRDGKRKVKEEGRELEDPGWQERVSWI